MASQNVCEPCSHDGKQTQAIKWCMECQEAICKDCAESHRKIKQVRNHRLIDLDEKAETVKFGVKKCKKHSKYEEEYFCFDHDVTCCRDCLAKDHKACARTVSVESACVGIRQSEILNEFATKTTAISKALEDIIQFCEENKQELETDADKIKGKVNRLEADYIKQIQIMKCSILDSLEKSKHEKSIKLVEKSEKAQSLKGILNNYQKDLNFVKEHGSERQLFLFLRQSEPNLSECENALQSTLLETHKVKLSLNKLPLSITEIGSVKVTETECSIEYVPPKHYQAQLLVPKGLKFEKFELVDRVLVPDSIIYGMAVNEDNKLLACTTGTPNGVNVFDQNNKFSKTIPMTKSDPWDIAIIPDYSYTAVVTFQSNIIQYLDTKALQPGKVVTLNSIGSGVSSTKDNIFVGSYGQILVLTLNGTLTRTISLSANSNTCISFIHVDSKDRILYSDIDIRCLTKDRKLLYSYEMEGEIQHWKIVTDPYGNVYTVRRESNEVVRLTPDGCMDRVILNEENGIRVPLALCFNMIYDKLYVFNEVSWYDEKILVFNCK